MLQEHLFTYTNKRRMKNLYIKYNYKVIMDEVNSRFSKTIVTGLMVSFIFIVFTTKIIAQRNDQQLSYSAKVNLKYHGDYHFTYQEKSEPLNYESKLESGSVEEGLVALYLHQEYEKFMYNYSPEINYYYLGFKSENLHKVRDKLSFEILYKLYYKIKDMDYCLVRSRIFNEKGDKRIYHSRLIFDKGLWKTDNLLGEDPDFINSIMLTLESKYLNDLLVTQKSEANIINRIVEESFDASRNAIPLEKMNDMFAKYKKDLQPYRYPEKNFFPFSWIKKYQ